MNHKIKKRPRWKIIAIIGIILIAAIGIYSFDLRPNINKLNPNDPFDRYKYPDLTSYLNHYKIPIEKVDKESFTILSDGFSFDKHRLYIKNKIQPNISQEQIEQLYLDYKKDFIKEHNLDKNSSLDINSLQILNIDVALSVDKKTVYLIDFSNGYLRKNQFKVLNDFWVTDGRDIYIVGQQKSDGKRYAFFFGDYEPADVKSFEMIDRIYAKDRRYVYYYDDIIQDADPKTFTKIDDDYAKDKQFIYYKGNILKNSRSNEYQIIEGLYLRSNDNIYYGSLQLSNADQNSFEVLSSIFSRDKNALYIGDRLLVNADYNSFRASKGLYAVDKNRAYHTSKIINESDYESFKVLSDNFAIDKNYVYYKNLRVQSADPNTFVVKDDHQGLGFDNSQLFIKTESIQDADANSYQTFDDSYYSIDKDHVFYEHQIINGSDAASFKHLDYQPIIKEKKQVLVQDKRYLYMDGEAVENINSHSFEVIDARWSRDQLSVFYDLEIVPEADVETFAIISKDYARDKNNVFCSVNIGEFGFSKQPYIIDGADPLSFDPTNDNSKCQVTKAIHYQ